MLRLPQALLVIVYTELIAYIPAGVLEVVHDPRIFHNESQSVFGSNSDATKLPDTEGYR